MTNNRDWNSTISRLTGWLVGFLALASFVLSYEALWTLAIDSEVTWWLAWLWPLTLDFFVLVASLSILRNSLNGHPRLYAWTLVVVFTALSIVFNAIHKGLPIEVYNIYALPYVPMVVYILPPVAFVFSLHLLVEQVGDIIKWVMQKVDSVEVAELERLLAERKVVIEELEEVISSGRADAKETLHKATAAEESARAMQIEATGLRQEVTQLQVALDIKGNALNEMGNRFDRAASRLAELEEDAQLTQQQLTALQTQAQTIADWNLLNATAKAVWIAQHTNGDRPPASHLAKALGCAVSTVSRAYEAVDKKGGN